MDLNELKNTWVVLDEQLKKNEVLNKQILREMLNRKSNKSLSRLLNTDIIGVIILFLVIPASVWLYNGRFLVTPLSVKILSVTCMSVGILGVIWYFFKLKHLVKIDFSGNVKDNVYYINKYNIMLKREKMAGSFILTPILVFLAAFCYYELKVNLSLWIFLVVGTTIAIGIGYWMYKKLYNSSIQSIRQSLEELEELKEG